jgi:hypothetical protein
MVSRLPGFGCRRLSVKISPQSGYLKKKKPPSQKYTATSCTIFLTAVIDKPFAQNNLARYLVQTSSNFLIKNKYPVRMTITNRSSNSPYFKNTMDVNLQFNRRQLLGNIKADSGTGQQHHYVCHILKRKATYSEKRLTKIGASKCEVIGQTVAQTLIEIHGMCFGYNIL